MTDLPVEGGNAHRHYGTDGFYITERALQFIDVVLGNASISVHGLMAKLSGDADDYFNGLGTWTPPVVPGLIMGWYGYINQCPDGWLVCDGHSGTPNLKDKFIV